MKIRKLRRPLGRPSPVDAAVIHRLLADADDAGIGLVESLPSGAADYLQSLFGRGYILLGPSHFAVTSRLSAALKRERDRNRKRRAGCCPESWPLTERVAAIWPEMASETAARKGISRAQYTVLLSRALQALKVDGSLHALLVLLTQAAASGRAVTVAGAAEELGCSYHAIVHHMRRPSNAHLFQVLPGTPSKSLTLSPEGAELLRQIEQRVQRYQLAGKK